MPSLFWLGNPYFSSVLSSLGWEVFRHRPATFQTFTWEAIVGLCGLEPDVLVLGDNSMPPYLSALERFPCLTVFYSVDSHIHSWHPEYAQAFDLCCLNLKDNMPAFRQRLQQGQLLWLPLFAPDMVPPPEVPEADKEYDLLFVGNVDPEIHPGRYAFLAQLGKRCPFLTVTRGKFPQLFPKARVVLNYAERGDLNFRVFQALGLGACLLTPRVGHGMLELFQDGKELFCFDAQNMEDLVRRAEGLLAAPDLRQEAGRAGLAAVDAGHRASHRGRAFSDWLLAHDWQTLTTSRQRQAGLIKNQWLRLLYLHMANNLPSPLKEFYLREARPDNPEPPR